MNVRGEFKKHFLNLYRNLRFNSPGNGETHFQSARRVTRKVFHVIRVRCIATAGNGIRVIIKETRSTDYEWPGK